MFFGMAISIYCHFGCYLPQMRCGNILTVCLCMSVCPVWALTFECLDLQTSLFVRKISVMVENRGHGVKVKG